MTENEWLEIAFPHKLLESLPGPSSRKRRLLACACARSILQHVGESWFHDAILYSEDHADGGSRHGVAKLRGRILQRRGELKMAIRHRSPAWDAVQIAERLTRRNAPFIEEVHRHFYSFAGAFRNSLRQGVAVAVDESAPVVGIRDIFGNPFRPVAFDPAWRTPTAVGVAQRMYEARDFAAMPILADALQDAGCEDETMLTHCRDAEQVHARGCWVVDLVLGKG